MFKKQKQQEEIEPKTFPQKIKHFFRELVVVLGVFLLLNNFVIASFMVPTGSMENEVMTGDFLMVNKFIYGGTSPRNLQQLDLLRFVTFGAIEMPNVDLPWFRLPAFKNIERGDVIVFEFPGMREEAKSPQFMFYLKRCLGIGGDTLEIKNRVVYINGKQSSVPRNVKYNDFRVKPPYYADERIFPPTAPFNEDNYGPVVIPKKGMEIFLTSENFRMWDVFIQREGHKANIQDGKIFIDGKENSTYTVEKNYLFGVGDNRDNSLDSRFWGFIPEENIVGSPIFVYWSWNPDIPIFDVFAKLGSVKLNRVGTFIK